MLFYHVFDGSVVAQKRERSYYRAVIVSDSHAVPYLKVVDSLTCFHTETVESMEKNNIG